MNPAHKPEQDGQQQPYRQRRQQSQDGAPGGQQPPQRYSEAGQPQASESRSTRVQCRRFPAAGVIDNPRAAFLFGFVFFDQRGARGEDGRKGKKQSAEHWPVPLGDQSGRDRYGAAKKEAQRIFVPSRSLQGRKIED